MIDDRKAFEEWLRKEEHWGEAYTSNMKFAAWAAWQAATARERERCAKVPDLWANSKSCSSHYDNPCCHVRTGAEIAAKIRSGE